jgi:hypothetical protein
MPAYSSSTLDVTVRPGITVSITNVFVDAWNTTPLLADDQQTPYGQELVARGTGLIETDETWNQLEQALTRGGNRALSAVLNAGPTFSVFAYYDASAATGDDLGGPYVKIETTEIVGDKLALVRWEVTRRTSYVENQTVVAHTWQSSISLDAAGQTTWTISGAVRVARSTTGSDTTLASQATWLGKDAYADLFRRAIIPPVIGEGWRRETQSFALDATGTMLSYTIVDKRYALDLPDGVRVGDMEFSYERARETQASAIVQFSCDLEGDLSLSSITGTTGNRRLVEAAVQLSKARINVSYQRMIIQRLRVTERNILSGYAIRFEMVAMVQPTDSTTGTAPVPLAFMIGNKFAVTRTVNRTMDSYGPLSPAAGVDTTYGMLPHWLENEVSGMEQTNQGMPQATVFNITGVNTYGTVSVTVIAGADGVSAMNSQFDGMFSATQYQPPNNSDGYTTIVGHNTSTSKAKYDSGIVRLSPMYIDAPDVTMQTRKPCVYVTERVETARSNQAPPKEIRPLPSNAYLTDDDWHVAYGKFDAQGNRTFTGIYERTFAMYDPGTSGAGFVTQTTPSGAQLRAWGAPNQIIIPTLAPVGTPGSQATTASVFDLATANPARYSVPTETFVT